MIPTKSSRYTTQQEGRNFEEREWESTLRIRGKMARGSIRILTIVTERVR